MSATLQINTDTYWMPAGWIYDNVLESMASKLSDTPELASLMLESLSDKSTFLDLHQMTPKLFQRLLRAAEDVLAETRSGSCTFTRPEYFPAYESKLKQLVDLLRSDPRTAVTGFHYA